MTYMGTANLGDYSNRPYVYIFLIHKNCSIPMLCYLTIYYIQKDVQINSILKIKENNSLETESNLARSADA